MLITRVYCTYGTVVIPLYGYTALPGSVQRSFHAYSQSVALSYPQGMG